MVDSKGITAFSFLFEKENKGVDQFLNWSTYSPPGCTILIRSPSSQMKAPQKGCFHLVDSKGIEPSNLTDVNRALSQLSYEPIFD